MRKLKFTFTRISLNQIYFSYVLPVLEYSSVVWGGCSLQDLNALDKLHNEASRIVTGHLIPRPLCNCNVEVENAEHYFFRRPKYVSERVELFHETRDFLTH